MGEHFLNNEFLLASPTSKSYMGWFITISSHTFSERPRQKKLITNHTVKMPPTVAPNYKIRAAFLSHLKATYQFLSLYLLPFSRYVRISRNSNLKTWLKTDYQKLSIFFFHFYLWDRISIRTSSILGREINNQNLGQDYF